MKRLRLPGLLLLLAIVASDARPAQKLRITMISFGDDLENKTWIKDYKQNYHTKAKIEESFRRLKDEGFSVIYWRMLWEGLPIDEIEFYSHRVQMEAAQLRKELENTPYAWDPHELRWPIEVAHRLGLKLYAWIVPYNMGAPPGASKELGLPPNPIRFPYGTVSDTEFGYYASFLRKHPEYQLVDRTGKRYHYGVLEWAYPEARRYWTDIVSALMAKYDLDGIYMDTRTECMAPDFADQFGFNEPVVAEYKRRYGVDIREEDFDLEKWRTLRGEYFTRFVREMSAAVRGRGRPLSLGTNRGDYIGFPLGNMKLEWRTWIQERLVDEFHGDERGWAWGRHGYGYLSDVENGRGLEPIETMVREKYAPLCRGSGVKLYFKPSLYRNMDDAWKKRLAALPEFDGVIERPSFR